MKYTKRNGFRMPKTKKNKFRTELCDDDMTFQDCELAILRHAVDETEKIQGKKIADSDDIKQILTIVEDFIRKKKLICYGGTAINNILPKYDQFYDKEIEIPDYDFFSPNALEDAKELADIYYENGYIDVEAKSGVHQGTFKVFVNFIPIADITYMQPDIYKNIFSDSIVILGMHYAPANYLRMAMYLELARPAGDVSRWEKVMKRLNLLNKHYKLMKNDNCHEIDFESRIPGTREHGNELYYKLRDRLIDQGVVFFGGYAINLYSRFGNVDTNIYKGIPQFDVLSEDAEQCAELLKEALIYDKIAKVKVIYHEAMGELIPEHYEIRIGREMVALIYKPIACHSYNKITIDGKEIKIATIDTILTFYLSFLYIDEPHYDHERLLCMAQYLFKLEEQNRLEQRGLLKRFSIDCYGKQATMEDIRAEKAEKYKELKNDRTSKEYQEWFLKYVPDRLKSGSITVEEDTKPEKEIRIRRKRTKKTKKARSNYLF